MNSFVQSLNPVRKQFMVLDLEQKENALRILNSFLEELNEVHVRQKVEDEAAKTVAGEAERIIMERFVDTLAPLPEFHDSFPWDSDLSQKPGFPSLQDQASTSQPLVDCNEMHLIDPTAYNMFCEPDRISGTLQPSYEVEQNESVSASADLCTLSRLSLDVPIQSKRRKLENFADNSMEQPTSRLSDGPPYCNNLNPDFISNDTRCNDRLTCETCGYQGNNRKALYRHRRSKNHPIPEKSVSPGAFSCVLCPFSSDKKYNYHRHLQRAHFIIRNHDCEYCGSSFKDRDTLRGHLRKVHKMNLKNKDSDKLVGLL